MVSVAWELGVSPQLDPIAPQLVSNAPAAQIPQSKPIAYPLLTPAEAREGLQVYAFPPNRATLGGTAYLIVEKDSPGNPVNTLIDCPPWGPEVANFLAAQGGVQHWILTHRANHGNAPTLQRELQVPLWVQEQEAYLLPGVPLVTPFHQEASLRSGLTVLWTPGYSPGSACVYLAAGGGFLFTGRHLLPTPEGTLRPLRFAKTFHWLRQLRQVEALQQRFNEATLNHFCPGANTGFLRGDRRLTGYHHLATIPLDSLKTQAPGPP